MSRWILEFKEIFLINFETNKTNLYNTINDGKRSAEFSSCNGSHWCAFQVAKVFLSSRVWNYSCQRIYMLHVAYNKLIQSSGLSKEKKLGND